jgi:hypothetical protein
MSTYFFYYLSKLLGLFPFQVSLGARFELIGLSVGLAELYGCRDYTWPSSLSIANSSFLGIIGARRCV